MELFGFSITRKKDEESEKKPRTFISDDVADGAVSVTSSTGGYGSGGTMSSVLDLDGAVKSEAELVSRYRYMVQQPEVSSAVDDIVNEAIVVSSDEKVVEINLDSLKVNAGLKKKISAEFDEILSLLDFSNNGYEIFGRWYVDGRTNFHIIVDPAKPNEGIQELRYIDPRKIRKIKEFENVQIGSGNNRTTVKRLKEEYYIYAEKGFLPEKVDVNNIGSLSALKISKDAIAHCNSGITNENNTLIISYLDKAYKPLNQLRMMEDASVIYRIARAPERRVFYIDVGNLPKAKAEQYLRDMMTKHKNRLVYDANTGQIRDDRRHMSMTDDFWLPRREGGKGTEITTLPGGQNLGEMEDIMYFQKRLYKALNVPISRMESETGFSLGRASEISRDEVKFSKFVSRLRSRFSILFDELLEKQLVLKNIITPDEWEDLKNNIRYDYVVDNHFQQMKEMEVIREKVGLLRDVDEYVGKYFSENWVKKRILHFTDDEIDLMSKEMQDEAPAEEEQMDGDVPQQEPQDEYQDDYQDENQQEMTTWKI